MVTEIYRSAYKYYTNVYQCYRLAEIMQKWHKCKMQMEDCSVTVAP